MLRQFGVGLGARSKRNRRANICWNMGYAAMGTSDNAAAQSVPFDLVDFVDLLKNGWRIIGATAVALGLLAVLYVMLATPYYRAQTVIVPSPSLVQGNGATGLQSRLGSLVGVLPSSDAETVLALAVLQSRAFAERFIERNNLLPLLVPKFWDEEKKDWKPFGPSFLGKILITLGMKSAVKDSRQYLRELGYKRLSRLRSIDVDRNTQIVTISLEWTDPDVAADWTNIMVLQLNEDLRQKKIDESAKRVQYLRQEFAAISITSLKNAFAGLLEQEIRSGMVANVRKEYAYQVVDPAVPATVPSRPRPVLAVFLSLLGGALLGIFGVMLKKYFRSLTEMRKRTNRSL